MTNSIRFSDVTTHRDFIGAEIDANVADVINTGQFIMGPHVAALEEELADFAAAADCVTCASGTDALLIPLMGLGIGRGDAVFVPSFTFIATAEVVALLHATPIFVDSGPDLTMSSESLEAAIKETASSGLRPAAVIPVDIFGAPANYREIRRIAADYEMTVLADAAQSFGAAAGTAKVGSLAKITATSFFPAKPLGCYGDGGAIFLDDPELAETLRSIRVHGKGSHKYDNVRIGINGRLDAIQAAVLRPKLGHLAFEIERRQQVAHTYLEWLSDDFVIPQSHLATSSAWAQFTMLVDERDQFVEHMGVQGIPTAIYYPRPVHMQEAFARYENATPVSLDFAADACRRAVSLPMHPYLTPGEIEQVIEAANGFRPHSR